MLGIGRLRARAARPAAAAAALLVLAVAGCGGGHQRAEPGGGNGRRSSGEAPHGSTVVRLAIDPKATTTPIPESFFGLSTEYWTLPVDERHLSPFGRVISLLDVPGNGPFILGVGGDSSDRAL